jgi:hypothetical protein
MFHTLYTVVLGILTFFFMPSYPEKANWLTEEEKSIQVLRLGVNSSHGYAQISSLSYINKV